MQHFKKQGFTLVEVLIVISIIALLAGITITAIGPARKKGRDAQRVSDLANIRIALALYKSANNGTYPVVPDWAINKHPNSVYQTNWTTFKGLLTPYISLPTDPLDSGNLGPLANGNYHYAYKVSADGLMYDLVAQFEDTKNPNRCEVKNWKRHIPLPDTSWCVPWTGNLGNSPYLYADH